MTLGKKSVAELSQCLGSLPVEEKVVKKHKYDVDNKHFVKNDTFKRPLKSYESVECYHCKEKGHKKHRCPQLKNDEKNKTDIIKNKEIKVENEKNVFEKSNKSKINCNFCGKAGHIEKECYSKKNKDKKEKTS